MRLKPLLVLLLLVLSIPSLRTLAQAPASRSSGLPAGSSASTSVPAPREASYAAESFVFEHLDAVYTFAADGTGSKEVKVAVRVQSEAAVRDLGVLTIPFASASERVEIVYARVRRPDGTVVETPVGDALELPDPVTRAAPFYSDLKQKQLPIKGLRPGDTLEWKARVARNKAEAPGQFWGQESFSDAGVVLSQTLELRVPEETAVKVWSPTLKPTDTVEGKERVYRWSTAHLEPTAGKEAEAAKELKKRHVWTEAEETDAMQGKLPSVAWTTFRSWDEVGAWYRGLEGERIVPDPEVKAKTAEVIAGKAMEEAKVQAIYAYVATQIRYVGVAFGVGRYQPHAAAEVLHNQYGDCKDKHTLLAAMLAAAGVRADAVLIGAGIRFNEAVPSPAAFNHLITRVEVAGAPVWLDATAEVAPYGMLSYVIRDREALLVPEAGTARLERTPVGLPFAPFQKMEAVGTLDEEGTSKSRLVLTARGDDELAIRSVVRQIAPAQYEELVQNMSRGMGYAGTTSNAEVSRPEDTAEPVKISYDYKREKSGDWDHLKIVPQLTPVTLPVVDESDPPVRAIQLGVPRVESSTSAIKLPAGWTAELPEAVHAKSAYATYDLTYRWDHATGYAERRSEVLKDKVPVADWKAYKKWGDMGGLGNENYISLARAVANRASPKAAKKEGEVAGDPGRTKRDRSTSGSTTGTELKVPGLQVHGSKLPDEEAVKLLQSAFASMQEHDLPAAQKVLDRLQDGNPEQKGLWAAYGGLELQRGQTTGAMEDLSKELKLHPDETPVYGMLVQIEQATGKKKEAMDSLRAWERADGSNPAPVTQLISMLREDGDGRGAVKEGNDALARLPVAAKKDEALQMEIGRAQILAGDTRAGTATLEAVLSTTERPGTMNDAAYELAEAGQSLALAETKTRSALDKLTEESGSWTMDENAQTLAGTSRLIVATWDTLGWVLFREGKTEEAQAYLNAAWHNLQNVDVGEHLAAVAISRGDIGTALNADELALATIPGYDRMGVQTAPNARQKKLQKQISTLQKAGARSKAGNSETKLQDLRKIPLGAAGAATGTAEYRLLLKRDGIAKLERVGEKEVAGGEALVRKASLTAFFPAGSSAALVRKGYLNCHSGLCELVLEP